MPETFVAVMGIEKVIPRLEDLSHFLEILARTATGQKLTTYTSFITGPRREGDLDGPREMHVVILDNGRSAMLADPVLREALNCIRCGACLNVCPIYRRIGGHAYRSVYPGPIGSIVSPNLFGSAAGHLPFASTLCGACKDICPVKIDIPRILLHLRWKESTGAHPLKWPRSIERGAPWRASIRDDCALSANDSRARKIRGDGAEAIRAQWISAQDAGAVRQLDQVSQLPAAATAQAADQLRWPSCTK